MRRMEPLLARARQLISRTGSVRARDFEAAGISRAQLGRLVARGHLIRLSRGLYARADREPSGNEALVVAAQRAPKAFFCLLTALRFHGLTTQAPFEVWIGLGSRQNPPRLDWPPLRLVRYSGAGLELGIETHVLEGVPVRVTGVARTVVDCFKFRNKIGLDVALEALRQVRRERRATMDEIWQLASQLRMTNVMRPYLEAQP